MAKEKFTGVKGMNDMLPQDAPIWQYVVKTAVEVLERYGYQEIRTPILENTRVFTRGVGEVTDIVEKEMYSFTDSMNGDQLTLRPECTSAVVRAVNEHNLLYGTTQRLWYCGPMFRHERPQRGRYRQFHQLGSGPACRRKNPTAPLIFLQMVTGQSHSHGICLHHQLSQYPMLLGSKICKSIQP